MRYPEVKISITTMDGELLDSFPVTHWQRADPNPEGGIEEFEYVGSYASESVLAERIRDYVEIAPKEVK